ncbi:unnamed protein product [Alopecurus aequalis]
MRLHKEAGSRGQRVQGVPPGDHGYARRRQRVRPDHQVLLRRQLRDQRGQRGHAAVRRRAPGDDRGVQAGEPDRQGGGVSGGGGAGEPRGRGHRAPQGRGTPPGVRQGAAHGQVHRRRRVHDMRRRRAHGRGRRRLEARRRVLVGRRADGAADRHVPEGHDRHEGQRVQGHRHGHNDHALRSEDINGRDRKKMEPRQEHEKRVVLETIVSLLPREKNTMSVSFLSMLLRAAIYLDTSLACRLDLEARMASQLGQAVLDDLLIPSSSSPDSAAFDVDAVQRILAGYLEHEGEATRLDYNTDDDFVSAASPPNDVGPVGRLMESYLAEISSDVNLPVDKFVGLAELIPERSRFNEDGMYRAIDIYLKAHPALSEGERKKVCSVMDCQKLSREACAHAAQNDRLPVQTVVQVLYHEQRRLRVPPSQPPSGAASYAGGESPALSYKPTQSFNGRDRSAPSSEVSRLQRENDELRMELLQLKMRLRDPSAAAPPIAAASGGGRSYPPSGKPPLPKKTGGGGGGGGGGGFMKKLGRLNPFVRDPLAGGKVRAKPPKDRRHSIS